jgi:hypothetical protein
VTITLRVKPAHCQICGAAPRAGVKRYVAERVDLLDRPVETRHVVVCGDACLKRWTFDWDYLRQER